MRRARGAAVEGGASSVHNAAHFVDERCVADVAGIGEVLQLLLVVESVLIICWIELDLF